MVGRGPFLASALSPVLLFLMLSLVIELWEESILRSDW
jgi:hypothetical protein